jgi:predicted tellurium resistance membrane protein TerC
MAWMNDPQAWIALIDIVFSLDSVITSVGMAEHVSVMIAAVVISVIIMMISAKAIGDFVEENPTIKILALSFLIMVGVALIGEGFEFHIPRGYIYFSMAFFIGVETLNMKMRKNRQIKLKLHKKVIN